MLTDFDNDLETRHPFDHLPVPEALPRMYSLDESSIIEHDERPSPGFQGGMFGPKQKSIRSLNIEDLQLRRPIALPA